MSTFTDSHVDSAFERETPYSLEFGGVCLYGKSGVITEAEISLSTISAHVLFDSEEQCQRTHAGDWQQRLARKRSVRG